MYPSITVCTPKASTPLEYPPALNESLVSIKYRFPNGSVQVVSPVQTMWMPDVENKTKTYAHNCLWKYGDDSSVGVLYLNYFLLWYWQFILDLHLRWMECPPTSFALLGVSHLIFFLKILQDGIIREIRILYILTACKLQVLEIHMQIKVEQEPGMNRQNSLATPKTRFTKAYPSIISVPTTFANIK